MPSVPLSELVARVPKAAVTGGSNPVVTGLTHDSRAVQPGDLYICKRGAHFDGHRSPRRRWQAAQRRSS